MKATIKGKLAAWSLTGAALAMFAGAAWLGGYPFYTDWRASQQQKTLSAQFAAPEMKDIYLGRRTSPGSPITRLVIERLGLDTIVVEGTSLEALASGAGHYPQTPLPGELGNVGIAGHRTMNGKPFADLDRLRPGDRIQLISPVSKFIYEVDKPFGGHGNPWIIHPGDFSVLSQSPDQLLTLTTCHPRGSSKQRLVARARLVESVPS